MTPATIRPATDADLSEFLFVADRVYKGDPRYCATPAESVLRSLRRPLFADRQQVFLAWQGSAAIGRVVARVSPTLHDADGKPLGLLGFFEALNDSATVTALPRAAAAWLRDQGCRQIIGPIDGDTWHRYRLNIGPWDEPPFLMEPYNPTWYPGLWEAAGFVPLADYLSKRVDTLPPVRDEFERHFERATRQGYRFRQIDLGRLDDELQLLHRLSLAIFAHNYLYTPIELDEFRAMYAGSSPLLASDLVWFAHSPDDVPVGFAFGVLDYASAVTAMRGRQNILAKLRFAWHRGDAQALNVKTLGVLPSARRTGLAGALIYLEYEAAIRRDLHRLNLCLIHADNASARLDADRGQVSRRYRLYHLPPA